MPDPRAVALSVIAFNDVAVHGRTTPQTLAELKAYCEGMAWATRKTNWQAAHDEYRDNFERESHDADTLNWRDQRAAALRKRSAADRQRQDRAPVRRRSNL